MDILLVKQGVDEEYNWNYWIREDILHGHSIDIPHQQEYFLDLADDAFDFVV